MATTTTTLVPAPVRTFYDKVLLKRAMPYLSHSLFGQKRPIPLNSGDQAKFRKYARPTAATTPLTEGVSPSSTTLTYSEVTATLATYGGFYEISDLVNFTSQDKILTEAAELCGEWGGDTIDQVYRAVLVAGTSVRYGSAVANRAAVTNKITATDLDVVIRALESNNAKYHTSIIKAGTGVGTTPIRAAYWGIIHPYVHYDLQNSVTGWVPVSEYASQQATHENEVGAYKNIRFVLSTNAKMWSDAGVVVGVTGLKYTTTNVDVFATLIFAMDAYGVVDLKGKGMQNIVKDYGSGDDPLNQRCTSGFKAITCAKILDENFMYRIETGATA